MTFISWWTVSSYVYNTVYSEWTACNSTLTRWLEHRFKQSAGARQFYDCSTSKVHWHIRPIQQMINWYAVSIYCIHLVTAQYFSKPFIFLFIDLFIVPNGMQNVIGLFCIGIHFVNHLFFNSASIGTEEQPTQHDLVTQLCSLHSCC